MVDSLIDAAFTWDRIVGSSDPEPPDETPYENRLKPVRWVTIAGAPQVPKIREFVRTANDLLAPKKIKLELVYSTGLSLGQLLFNNNCLGESSTTQRCGLKKCKTDPFMAPSTPTSITSTQTHQSFKITSSSNCTNGGIYCLTCKACHAQYVGKTATSFKLRHAQHFQKSQ